MTIIMVMVVVILNKNEEQNLYLKEKLFEYLETKIKEHGLLAEPQVATLAL